MNVPEPAPWVMLAGELDPSPHVTITACVSSVPTSVNEPVKVTVPFSSMVVSHRTRSDARMTGSTLFTVTVVLWLPTPVSSSVRVAAIAYVSLGRPLGLSSRY